MGFGSDEGDRVVLQDNVIGGTVLAKLRGDGPNWLQSTKVT